MKLLTRKGFTLIELLAVIIILGVVMVLTIPSVIDSMNNAKYKQLQNAANTVADYILEQYTIEQMDSDSLDSAYKSSLKGNIVSVDTSSSVDFSSLYVTSASVTDAAGISDSTSNITRYCGTSIKGATSKYSFVFYNKNNGKMCVRLQAKKNGQFFNNLASEIDESKVGSKNVALSSGCPIKNSSGSYTDFYNTWSKYLKVNCL